MALLKFLRRFNRGIALGIALFIGLSCYLAVDAIAFQSEKEVILQRIEDYLEQITALHLLPEEYREIGAKVPDEVVQAKKEQLKTLVDNFFVHGGEWDFKAQTYNNAEYMLNQMQEMGGKIKSYSVTLARVNRITKHGSSIVVVSGIFTTTLESTPNAAHLDVFDTNGGGGYFVLDWAAKTGNIPVQTAQTEETGAPELSFNSNRNDSTFAFEMVKRDGVWKFSKREWGAW